MGGRSRRLSVHSYPGPRQTRPYSPGTLLDGWAERGGGKPQISVYPWTNTGKVMVSRLNSVNPFSGATEGDRGRRQLPGDSEAGDTCRHVSRRDITVRVL
ncbi:hypothetical protein DPEC_G00160460 [Dallia pectoralis]|uniref:Uncharacterized protein n=1 Tax=Dallia pectoralis TaxID=75939 RepID=A0ACC2GGG3_DALPE|nr:hypothetical protein DPEC_G00160460 [Dallia pectoralis]